MTLSAQQNSIRHAVEKYKEASLTHVHDIHIVTYINHLEQPCVKIWFGRQDRPKHRYYFQSVERRTAHIEKVTKAAEKRVNEKKEEQAKKKGFVPNILIGDIYVSSWGYDQTNVDFYQVINKPSPHFAVLAKIAHETVPGSEKNMSCYVTPIKDSYSSDNSVRKKVVRYGKSQCVNIDDTRLARLWDGKPEYKSWYA